jgi:excinuclease UvrABC nuclease subunit
VEYKEEYKQIVRSISSFFEGNTREIKKKITEDIHEAIKKEHFERCARLRDILNQVDARSEKQHVVLDPNYSGLIVRITPLQNFWVIILVKIFEGKMTDVIREKKSKEERSFNQMKASLEADFGEMKILEDDFVILSEATAKSKDAAKQVPLGYLLSTIIKDSSTSVGMTKNNHITLLSKSMKKIKKSAQTQIDILLQKFLDSYIASTTFDTEDNLTQDLL